MRATRVLIHLDRLVDNLNKVKTHLSRETAAVAAAAGKTAAGGMTVCRKRKIPRICMPVKADAYGHGAAAVAWAALNNGVEMLSVATVDEGIALRRAGISSPVLLLSPALPCELEAAVFYKLTPFVSEKTYIAEFADAATKQRVEKHPVYLKIETGMGRGGCSPNEAVEFSQFIAEQPALIQTGTATHFAVSDSDAQSDVEWTRRQIKIFRGAVQAIREAGLEPGIITAANSGATAAYNEAWFDMVRPGIILYGYQSKESKPDLNVTPVMEFVTQVVMIKKICKGDSVSYGRTWTAPYDTYIGVLPAGYADGIPRALSCCGEKNGRTNCSVPEDSFFVVINGVKYPLAGRICMDQCMINLGAELKVNLYDSAVIFGGNPPSLDAAGIAQRTGTIPYEVLCNINKRVERVYV
ncbi:MAG: alanine racemase [Spirochaetaceae bacterium]|jgi:alanine racemase|nr:alanine racemase [Spirochaetaceae bacterium]